jgi:hypothetical protein
VREHHDVRREHQLRPNVHPRRGDEVLQELRRRCLQLGDAGVLRYGTVRRAGRASQHDVRLRRRLGDLLRERLVANDVHLREHDDLRREHELLSDVHARWGDEVLPELQWGRLWLGDAGILRNGARGRARRTGEHYVCVRRYFGDLLRERCVAADLQLTTVNFASAVTR